MTTPGTELDVIHGELVTDEPDRIAPLVERWLWSYRDSHATRDGYRRDVDDWLLWCRHAAAEPIDPLDVQRADIDAYAALLANTISPRTKRITSPATLARKLSAISSWYKYLHEEGFVTSNPLTRVRRPRIDASFSATTSMSAEQATALLAAAQRDRWLGDELAAAVAGFLIHIGARVSEVCAVDVGDLGVDSDHRTVRLRWMKGGKQRVRAMPPALCRVVDRYLDERARREGVPRRDLAGALFVVGGQRLDRHEVYRFVRRAAKTAKLPQASKITPHSFRHAWATIARERGASLEERQYALGHADPRTTQRYDRARASLDRDPSYLVAAAVAPERDEPPGEAHLG